MDFLAKLRGQIQLYLLAATIVTHALLIAAWYGLNKVPGLSANVVLLGLGIFALLLTLLFMVICSNYLMQPVAKLWAAILHVSPGVHSTPPPNLNRGRLGRELVASLVSHVYQLASVADNVANTGQVQGQALHTNFIASALPLPLLVLDKDQKVIFANEATAKYLTKTSNEIVGQELITVLDMSFSSDRTFNDWLDDVKQHTVSANSTWERVRLGLPGQADTRLFDLAAHYNKSNPLGYETILVLFDHTEMYSQDDQAMSFVALSVHELRTPLTLLRGYIEVFDEEIGPNLNSELKDFMQKMDASAQQLAGFVDNILNVAKIEDNQLTLQLHEEDWQAIVDNVVEDMSLRAAVRGIKLKTDIDKDLPKVGVDRYSIYEVIANLIDNAIKYSKGTTEIYITARKNEDGLVETSVKDYGLGINSTVLPHIFDKFYRNHRNRAQIGGTGLGLFLAKSIIDAHGGQIWVQSKENEGSTFTFTVQPYAALAENGAASDTKGISRGAHGWIKNHSLYRG